MENNIFLTWEKMAPSVDYLQEESLLKILCATEAEQLKGIAPFRIVHKHIMGPLSYRIIEYLTNGETDYSGFILKEEANQCLSQFLTHLFSQKNWDFIYLPDLPQSSKTLELIKKTRGIPSFTIKKGHICPYITIPDSKEKLLANANPKFQKKLRKQLRKLERDHGKTELKQYYEMCSLEDAIKILIKLHQQRWVSKGQPGRFCSQKSINMTLLTARYFAEKGWLRIYFLKLGDRVVAVELNLEYGGKMYCHLKGFDPDYSKYSVGNLLTLKVLEECVEKKIREYDFMQGDEDYKFKWTSKYRRNTNLEWVNNKLSSRLLNAGLQVAKKAKNHFILSKCIEVLFRVRAVFNGAINL